MLNQFELAGGAQLALIYESYDRGCLRAALQFLSFFLSFFLTFFLG